MIRSIPFSPSFKQLFVSVVSVLLLLSAQQGFSATPKGFVDQGAGKDLVPSGKGWGEAPDARSKELANFPGNGGATGKAKPSSGSGINYHGGPLLNGNKTTIYYIWYGDWSGNSAQTILTDLANSFNTSPYFNINTTYYDGAGIKVPNTPGSMVLYSPQAVTATTAPYSTALSDTDILNIVKSAITAPAGGAAALPADENGVYFVLTSKDVNATSGFCTKYCGWHTHGIIGGKDIKYSFVGNPDRCPTACEWQTTVSPNGNTGADGMASVIAHELSETVTDPDLNAWFDTRGYENADKCAWKFGATSKLQDGSLYNVTLKSNVTQGSRNYLIQQNWLNLLSGSCQMAY
jgi:hypothetical protein